MARIGDMFLNSNVRPVLFVLSSLRAEGVPNLVLDLCRVWVSKGIKTHLVDLQCGPAELESEFLALGVQIHRLRFDSSGYRRYLALVWHCFWLCRQIQPSAVLCMRFGLHSPVAVGARLAGVRRCCAHVGNPPGVEGTEVEAVRKARCLVALGRPFTYRLVCCSGYVQARTIENMRVSKRDTCVIYNGVQLNAFNNRPRPVHDAESSGRVWRLGMIATLEDHKDQATLIRAAALLAGRGYELEIRLIGDGMRRQSLVELVKELDAPVYLLGSRSDVPDQLAELDLFVFATTEHEGLGIALIEAMAAGVPVVASDVAACREVLDNGELGLLAAPHDAQALANAVTVAISEWHETQARAAQAYDKAINSFSAEAMASHYLDVLVGVKADNREAMD